MTRKFAWLVFVAAFLALAVPSAAFADKDNDKDRKVPITCTLTLGVTDAGTSTVRGKEVRTKAEKTAGQLNCDLDSLDGAFSTKHDSEIKLKQDGTFHGNLEGTFTVEAAGGTLRGEMKARVSGSVVGPAPSPPFPPGTLIHRVVDNGKWEITRGHVEGNGRFAVTLVGIVGVPASSGGLATVELGSLEGKVEIEGRD